MKRFFDKVVVDPETGCWNWKAQRTWNGYGRFRLDGKLHYAHRVCYELVKGKIPEGLELDHLCRNRGCVRPGHLEAVTHQENVRRGVPANSAKTHCLQGHRLSGDNLYVRPDGERVCRTCRAERARRYRTKKKKGANPANGVDARAPIVKGAKPNGR